MCWPPVTPTAAARSAPASACRSSSCRPTRPGRCTWATAAARRTGRAWPTCWQPPASTVEREYYVNDAGRQMDILAVSVWLRYLEFLGEELPFPAGAYRGDYVRAIATDARTACRRRFSRTAGEVLDGLPPDGPQGGDVDQYLDALIARAKLLLGPCRLRPPAPPRLRHHPGRHRRRPDRVRRQLRPLVSREQRWSTAARWTAPSRPCAPAITCTRRTAPGGFGPPPLATARTGW